MRGFSFVDDINHRKRQEAKLDERLRLEAEDRAHLRTRQAQADDDIAEDRRIAAEDRTRIANERTLGQEGDRLAVDPTASRDDLLRTASFSANAFNRLKKEMGHDELLAALKTLGPQAGTQTGGLNASATAGNEVPGDIAPPGTTGSVLLGPSRGLDTLESVDLDDLSTFDPDAPRGFGEIGGIIGDNTEGAGERITRAGRGLSTAAANMVNKASNSIFGTSMPPVAAGESFGSAISGNISVPEAFTTEEEFASITDPAKFEAARKQNQQIIAGLKERGARNSNERTADMSRLDLLREGSRADRAEAQRQEFIVTQRYQGFNDPTIEHKARSLAAEDPTAAVIQYSDDRATLKSVSPGLAEQMDREMRPAFLAAEQEAMALVSSNVRGTAAHSRGLRDLNNVRATQKAVYKEYQPARAAGIDDRGLPIGNSELSNNLLQEIENPDRPRNAAPFAGTQVQAANTLVSRIAGNRRASEVQIKAAIVMKDAGLASGQDVLTLAMTGIFPPTAPAAQLKSYKPGDVVYTVGVDGSFKYAFTVPGGKDGTRGDGGTKLDDIGANQIQAAGIEQFRQGIRTMFPAGEEGSEQFEAALVNQLLIDADKVQETVDLTDPIAMLKLGQTYAGSLALASAEDSPWIPNFMESAPTMQEILATPSMAASLAVEHNIPLATKFTVRTEGVNINNLRQELLIPGKYPVALEQAAREQDDDTFLQTVARYDLIRAQNSQTTEE
jgi:hypothetical protein